MRVGWVLSLLTLATLGLEVKVGRSQALPSSDTSLVVDQSLARQGRSVFQQKGCTACHTIGRGKGAGPDLAGVIERRGLEWLRHFIRAPEEMFVSDSVARALLAEFNNVKMPNLKLTDKEIDAVLHYLADETARRRK